MLAEFVCSLSLAFVRLHSADQEFLRDAIRTEAKVVTLSMLALRKTSTPKMQAFASELLAHHGTIGRRLNDMLGKSAFDFPSAGYAHDGPHLESLANMHTDEFTQVAIREMSGLLDERARLFDAATKRHGNLDVRALAREMMPAVRRDADRVRSLGIK